MKPSWSLNSILVGTLLGLGVIPSAFAQALNSSATGQTIEWRDVQNVITPAAVGTNTIARKENQITFDAIADGQYVRYNGNCAMEVLYRLKIGRLDENRQPFDVVPYPNEKWFAANDIYQVPILSTACALSQ